MGKYKMRPNYQVNLHLNQSFFTFFLYLPESTDILRLTKTGYVIFFLQIDKALHVETKEGCWNLQCGMTKYGISF